MVKVYFDKGRTSNGSYSETHVFLAVPRSQCRGKNREKRLKPVGVEKHPGNRNVEIYELAPGNYRFITRVRKYNSRRLVIEKMVEAAGNEIKIIREKTFSPG